MAKQPAAPTVVSEEVEPPPAGTIVQNDETREMFEDCEDGDVKTLRVRIDKHDDAAIAFTPLEVIYDEEVEPEDPAGLPKAIKQISKAGY